MEQSKLKGVQDALHAIDREMRARRFGLALDLAQQAANKFPETRPVEVKLAEVLETCKEFEKALGIYRHVHEKTQAGGGTSEIGLLVGIARCQIRLAQYSHATKLLEELKVLAPEYPPLLTALATCRRHDEKIEEAEQLIRLALKHEPDSRLAIHELAQIHLAKKESEEALKLLERNIRRKDLYGNSIDLWLATLHEANRDRYAQDTLEELMKIHPDTVEFSFGYAVLANQAGEITLARPAYRKSMELSANNPRIIYELGVLERTAGNLELSQDLIRQAIELKPDNPAAIRTYCSDMKLTYGDENFKRINFVAAKPFDPVEQIHMHYAMAKAYEDVSEMDTAFRHFAIAGEKKRKKETYSDREAAKMAKIIQQVVTKARLAETHQVGCQSEIPVFILGMPRSGTSLMEQILSAHPDVFGAGELKNSHRGSREHPGGAEPAEHERKRPSVSRNRPTPPGRCAASITSINSSSLPTSPINASSIRCPATSTLSVSSTRSCRKHGSFIAVAIQWRRACPATASISPKVISGRIICENSAAFYKRYWDLMKFWRQEFPGVMFEVRYEDNVADVEGQAKKIIAHLGLEWDENCLNFYNVDRPVKTASVTQVRRPIYTTSTNRWRQYEKYLGPLKISAGVAGLP